MQIARGDLVVVSARVIPGNERTIGRVINSLYRRGAEVLYDDNAFVHVSGHASQDDLKRMLELTQPRYFVPVHGEYRHLLGHARLAASTGLAPERIFLIEDDTGRAVFAPMNWRSGNAAWFNELVSSPPRTSTAPATLR